MPSRSAAILYFSALCNAISLSTACGQWACPEPHWQSTGHHPGVFSPYSLWGPYCATSWDADGPGGQAPFLVIGGGFQSVGSVVANGIAVQDPETHQWSPLGDGINGIAFDIESVPDGSLVVAGRFSTAGSASAHRVALWVGNSWAPLGSGLGNQFLQSNESVYALAVDSQGRIIAGGDFKESAKNFSIRHIAAWTGQEWLRLGDGLNARVRAMVSLPNGDLIAGGDFNTIDMNGGPALNKVARWNGRSWSALGSGFDDAAVSELIVAGDGAIVAGGSFTQAGGITTNRIARWDGVQWNPLATGMTSTANGFAQVIGLSSMPNGDIIACGEFGFAGGKPAKNIARWNGVEWMPLGTGLSNPASVVAVDPVGDLVVGGEFSQAGGVMVRGLAKWDGAAWSASVQGKPFVNGPVLTVKETAQDILVGGSFTALGNNQPMNRIARWDASKGWIGLGSGITGTGNPSVQAVETVAAGNVIAGGHFSVAGGLPATNIARWNGQQWSPLADGLGSVNGIDQVHALATMPQTGDLIAGGNFALSGTKTLSNIARWDGVEWLSLGAGLNSRVYTLETTVDGGLIVGGMFLSSGGQALNHIARWDGETWSPFGAGIGGYVHDITIATNGDMLVSGQFLSAGNKSAKSVARWNGSVWSALGEGLSAENGTPTAWAIHVLPNGHVLAGGDFERSGSTPVGRIAEWDGAAWTAFEGGIQQHTVSVLVRLQSGLLAVGGTFSMAGDTLSPNFVLFGCSPTICYADCDQTGSLNIDDFVCFQTLYALGDPASDCDANGSLNIDDFVCFQTSFSIGC